MHVVISGWNDGMNKVQLNHALRDHAGYGLSDAKNVVDQLLAGKTIVIDAGAGGKARRCFAKLSQNLAPYAVSTSDFVGRMALSTAGNSIYHPAESSKDERQIRQ